MLQLINKKHNNKKHIRNKIYEVNLFYKTFHNHDENVGRPSSFVQSTDVQLNGDIPILWSSKDLVLKLRTSIYKRRHNTV